MPRLGAASMLVQRLPDVSPMAAGDTPATRLGLMHTTSFHSIDTHVSHGVDPTSPEKLQTYRTQPPTRTPQQADKLDLAGPAAEEVGQPHKTLLFAVREAIEAEQQPMVTKCSSMPLITDEPKLTSEVAQPRVMKSRRSDAFSFHHSFARISSGADAAKLSDCYTTWGSTLGKGAFGTVRSGRCRQTGAKRAIKSIALTAVKDQARLESEIDIARQLDHPNIARLFEIFRDTKHIHLVMELCSGGELFDRISKQGPDGFPEAIAAAYVRQVLAAICYLHGQRIAHRDLKPENLLLLNAYPCTTLKLVDFGAARRFEPGVCMRTQVGTPYYVAPELLAGRYDERCDVWSVGVICYILLCGYPPFQGKTIRSIVRRVTKGKVSYDGEIWDQTSTLAKVFVDKLLDMDLETRPSAKEARSHEWLAVAQSRSMPKDMLARLKRFQGHRAFKQVAVTAIAQRLPDEDIEEWRAAFAALDADGDGRLSLDELRAGLEAQGMEINEDLEETLEAADSDGSGCLDYTEFLAATIDQRLYAQPHFCQEAFNIFDLDGNGQITEAELRQVLSAGAPLPLAHQKHIKEMFEEVDVNDDGQISFEEFLAMMRWDRNSPLARQLQTRRSTRSSKDAAARKARRKMAGVAMKFTFALSKAALSICGYSCGPLPEVEVQQKRPIQK